MQFIVTKDNAELSDVIASHMLAYMHSNSNRVNICLTTGITPISAYNIVAPLAKDKAYFEQVHYYVVDEFWYAGEDGEFEIPDNKRSLDVKFFHKANIPECRIHTLSDSNVTSFDYDIELHGGMDMVLMGVGTDGHFCSNHPGTFTSWDELSHKIDRYKTKQVDTLLTFLLREDIKSDDESRIPDHYLTMGPKSIMKAKNIIFIFSGKGKANTVKRAFFEPVSLDFPVSIFQLHLHVTVLLDQDASSEIQQFI